MVIGRFSLDGEWGVASMIVKSHKIYILNCDVLVHMHVEWKLNSKRDALFHT